MKNQITKSISGWQNSGMFKSFKTSASTPRLFVYALELVLLFILVFATVSTFAQAQQPPVPAKAISESGKLEFVKQQIVYNSGKVYFNWIVKANSEDCIYVIERSTDGVEFEPVGLKEGIGSPLELLYSWVDTKPAAGTAFYRIKQIDSNGNVVSQGDSKTVSIPEANPLFIEKSSRMVYTK